jgi:ribosomal-protein-alanine N-acetyltransferase
MALRLFGGPVRSLESIETARLFLRQPEAEHFAAWSALRGGSRAFLTPWEPEWAPDELTRAAFRRRLKRYAGEIERDENYPYFLFLKAGGALVGGLTLGHVRRGVSQTATIGYWMGERHAGQGLMREALLAACRHGFSSLGFHRLEAACVPENERSRRLLARCGFHEEGRARQYLRIAGAWRDHVLYARLAGDPEPPPAVDQAA